MVHEVTRTFAEAFVIALFLFLSGLFVGLMLDNWRIEEVRRDLLQIETDWMDVRAFESFLLENNDPSLCNWALHRALLFNERIYKEGRKIEEYEAANKLTDLIEAQKRKYIAMKVEFLRLAELLKQRCDYNYHIVMHLYKRYRATKDEIAKDRAVADALLDAKYACGPKMILVPLQTDLNLLSVDYIVQTYGVRAYPAVIVDGNVIVEGGIISADRIKRMLGC